MNCTKQQPKAPHDFAVDYGIAMTFAPRDLRDCIEADARPIREPGET